MKIRLKSPKNLKVLAYNIFIWWILTVQNQSILLTKRFWKPLRKKTSLEIDFGGGLKTLEDIEIAFNSGAKQITIGSIAVQDPDFCFDLIEKYGPDKIILGADCENRKIKTSGWLEESQLDVIDFILKYKNKGIKNVICTDISKDGMLQGASDELYREIVEKTAVQLIASGGISCIEDVEQMKKIGCSGTIIGKAIYEGRVSLQQLQNFIENA